MMNKQLKGEMIMTESTTRHSNEMNRGDKGRYAEIHGLKMYYEIHGEGFPLILLHGGLSTIVTSLLPSAFSTFYSGKS